MQYVKYNHYYLKMKFSYFTSSYSLTDRAWRHLRDMGEDQVIILTGSSGSGKTEAAKLTQQYLSAVTSHHRDIRKIKYQILQSNPVLEGKKATLLGGGQTSSAKTENQFLG